MVTVAMRYADDIWLNCGNIDHISLGIWRNKWIKQYIFTPY